MKTLEKQIKQSSNNELPDFERTVFEERQFSYIQKYLKFIRKTVLIPPTVKLNDEETSVEKKKQNYSIGISFQYLASVKSTTANTNEGLKNTDM